MVSGGIALLTQRDDKQMVDGACACAAD
eukprot:COSAG06_NODE_5178_length_3657_cov_3.391231_1_plen_27_part_10